MPRPQAEAILRLEERPEKRQPAHVVEVGMSEEEVRLEAHALEGLAQVAQAGARVEEQPPLAAAHLERGGVAAVARGRRARAGDAAAHAPEAHREGHWSTIPRRL